MFVLVITKINISEPFQSYDLNFAALFQASNNSLKNYVESYRLQSLEPFTKYVVQIRCKHYRNLGFWSEWCPNVTAWTPEHGES